MFLVLIRFLETLLEWASTGRYPREELRFRWWLPLATVGAFLLFVTVFGGSIWLISQLR